MQRIGVWLITNDGPRLARPCDVELEQHLEGWIAANPDMVQHGLRIVARQLRTDAGPLDLLALDPQGRWVVIEVKRGRLYRETVAQAQDYVSCIRRMPFGDLRRRITADGNPLGMTEDSLAEVLRERQADEDDDSIYRDVLILLVGTSLDPGLERMVADLSSHYQMPIQMVTFNVVIAEGQKILIRELAAKEGESPAGQGTRRSVEDILAKADQEGIGQAFRTIHEAAHRHGLAARSYKKCIMYAPPDKKTRCLFAVWLYRSPGIPLEVYPVAKAFAEFYPVSEQQAVEILGTEGYYEGTPEFVEQFVERLNRLFEAIGGNGEEAGNTQAS